MKKLYNLIKTEQPNICQIAAYKNGDKVISENRRIFKLVIKHFHLMNMDEVHNRMFKYIFEPILIQFGVPPEERAYVIKFYLTGVFAIVMEWLDHDCRDNMDFIIKIINDCVLGARNIDG
jgi:hypothetical protein